MKKCFLLIFICLLIPIETSYAINLEKKLAKYVFITKKQINEDYVHGEELNEKIRQIFVEYRYYKDKETLKSLEILLREKIHSLYMKKNLSEENKKILNFYKNIYYRTLLLQYYI